MTIAGAGRTAVSSVATGCISWVVAVGGTTGLAGHASLCLSCVGKQAVLGGLNFDASRHTVFWSFTLLAWIVEAITFVAMYTYGSNGVSPLSFFSRFTSTTSPTLNFCSLALCLVSW